MQNHWLGPWTLNTIIQCNPRGYHITQTRRGRPSTASEVFSFFDNMSGLLGCIIVTQPSEISALGMTRTIDFLRHKEIPIMGLVTMRDGYLCPSCGLVTHQLLSSKLAMEKVAKGCGIPFLISIPQTPAVGLLKPYFDKLARMVLKCRPITLKKQTLLRRVQGKAGELGVRTAAKFM